MKSAMARFEEELSAVLSKLLSLSLGSISFQNFSQPTPSPLNPFPYPP